MCGLLLQLNVLCRNARQQHMLNGCGYTSDRMCPAAEANPAAKGQHSTLYSNLCQYGKKKKDDLMI